jgi:hypothetical protein
MFDSIIGHGRSQTTNMTTYQDHYEHSNPLFPLVSKYVYQEEWDRLKSLGAKIVPEQELCPDAYFAGDDDPTISVPVIEFKGVKYDRFMNLIRQVHGDRAAQELINIWNKQLLADRRSRWSISQSNPASWDR